LRKGKVRGGEERGKGKERRWEMPVTFFILF